MKLIATKKIDGIIKVETGLHIGGAKNSLDIGGLDSPVIKTPNGVPYIPGSSLKGKIRTLLALKESAADFKYEPALLKKMFGCAGDYELLKNAQQTTLIVRNAHLKVEALEEMFGGAVLETQSTEPK